MHWKKKSNAFSHETFVAWRLQCLYNTKTKKHGTNCWKSTWTISQASRDKKTSNAKGEMRVEEKKATTKKARRSMIPAVILIMAMHSD